MKSRCTISKPFLCNTLFRSSCSISFANMMGLLLSLGAFVAGSQAISFENAAKSCDSNVHLSGNPFTTRNLHPNSIYRSQVLGAAVAITDPSLKAKALKVADIGTFLWLNSTTQLSRLEEELQTLPCSDILGVVVSNLPVQQPCDTLEPWNIAQYKFRFIDREFYITTKMLHF